MFDLLPLDILLSYPYSCTHEEQGQLIADAHIREMTCPLSQRDVSGSNEMSISKMMCGTSRRSKVNDSQMFQVPRSYVG